LLLLRQGVLLHLNRPHADREGLLMLRELPLERLSIVVPDEEHSAALVDRRLARDLPELLEGPLDLPQLRLELDALGPEDLELVLQLLILRDLVLELRRDVFHRFTSRPTRTATSAHRRYEFTAALKALVSSAALPSARRFRRASIDTRALRTSRPVFRRNASSTT